MRKFSERRRTGNLGESVACQYLDRKGYSIIERNFLRPWGEIDIVAEKGGIVRFVEVKAISRATSVDVARENDAIPEELVDRKKLEKLARTAEQYMYAKRDGREYQIDVVGVILDRSTMTARCRLFEQVMGG